MITILTEWTNKYYLNFPTRKPIKTNTHRGNNVFIDKTINNYQNSKVIVKLLKNTTLYSGRIDDLSSTDFIHIKHMAENIAVKQTVYEH